MHNSSLNHIEKNFFKEIGESPDSFRDKTVLDAGCGDGSTAAIMCKYSKRVWALDLDESVAQLASSHLRGCNNASVIVSDLRDIPCKNESFDYIYCCGVILLIKEEKKTFEELTRVLKPKAKMFIVVPGDYGLVHKVIKFIRPATRIFNERVLIFVVKMFVPPSWVLKNICTWLNMNVSPLVVRDKVIRACLNYLSPAYYKFYRREELLQLFSKDFTDVRSNEMHVVRDKWFKRYLVGVGLQIKGVKVDKNDSTANLNQLGL
jgi:ubiquinone/menaquinone biosynthesis C-methylase UbiE